MSTPAVPAWKKLGLKVKENIGKDPLTGKVQTIPAAATPGKKRQSTTEADTENPDAPKKPPKRVKLPKAERKPPPEADQLAYLRQYHDDRANWKFSKQKQNWILRSVYSIPETYADALVAYLGGLQGGAKDRAIEEAEEVVKRWNEYMTATDEPKQEDAKKAEAKEDDATKKKETDAKEETISKAVPPSEPNARLARLIIQSLTGATVKLELLEEEEDITADATTENAQTEALEKSEEPEKPAKRKEDSEKKESKKEKKEKKEKKDKKDKSETKEKKDKKDKKDRK